MFKIAALCCALLLALTSCNRDGSDISAILRSKMQKVRSLWEGEELVDPADDMDYMVYEDELDTAKKEAIYAQSSRIPGDRAPSLDRFRQATAQLAAIFKVVNFNTDEYVVRKTEHHKILERIAIYMKHHPELLVSVEGHCDQRASESYNLALGTKRANYIRAFLIEKGVEPDRIFTISFGKERPLDNSDTPQAWAKNRRVEFKIHEAQ